MATSKQTLLKHIAHGMDDHQVEKARETARALRRKARDANIPMNYA